MSTSEPPAPFEADRIETVAAEFDVAVARLAELVDSHQALVDRLPGVENLVYEWRKQFGASVLARSESWYVVAAPEWTWDEFADDLAATDEELAALAVLHARTVREHPDIDTHDVDGTTPVVLNRE